jgi:hypothetical protein
MLSPISDCTKKDLAWRGQTPRVRIDLNIKAMDLARSKHTSPMSEKNVRIQPAHVRIDLDQDRHISKSFWIFLCQVRSHIDQVKSHPGQVKSPFVQDMPSQGQKRPCPVNLGVK